MATADRFAAEMRRRARSLEKNSSRVQREAALVVVQVATLGTPVDTGDHRSRWHATLGGPSPLPSVVDILDVGEVISRARSVLGRHKTGQITVSNNGPAIEQLDRGSSAQAPAGISAGALAAARALLRGARLLRDR